MKKLIFTVLMGAVAGVFSSCDRIEKPYLPAEVTELDHSLFPGAWTAYPWPSFAANGPTDRNILLEDYTGHKCIYCPAAAVVAEGLESNNPGRVFVASMHTSPGGMGPFQTTDAHFTNDLTNPEVLEYGTYFSTGFGFDANPKGTINRKQFNGFIFQGPNSWSSLVSQVLNENSVTVDLQAKANYFTATRGLFLHALVDLKNVDPSEVTVVNYLIKRHVISPQKYPGGVVDEVYKHHNLHLGSIDKRPMGRAFEAEQKNSSGKYELNYSYKLPATYDADDLVLFVYIRHKVTQEILQVVEVNLDQNTQL